MTVVLNTVKKVARSPTITDTWRFGTSCSCRMNAVIAAIDSAIADVRQGLVGPVPPHLRDGHYEGAQRLGNAQGYVYPHDDPRGVVAQQYLPTQPVELHERTYYTPTGRGNEATLTSIIGRVRRIIRGH